MKDAFECRGTSERRGGALATLAMVVVLLATLALAGCGGGAASSARDSLQGTMQTLQDGDVQLADSLFEAVWFYPEDYGVSAGCFAEQYFKDFAFTVGEGADSGKDAATAKLTVTVPAMSDVLATLEAARDEALASGAVASTEGYANQAFAAACEQASWSQDELALDVGMVRSDEGAWDVEDKAMLAAVLLDGYDPRQVAQ